MYHQHKCGNSDHDCGSYYQVEWVYMVNRIGPSTDPCETPYFSVTGSDVLDPIWTICILSWRYDLNHLKVSPLIPNEWFNRSKSFWWSMVSKAALRSKSVNMAEGGPFVCIPLLIQWYFIRFRSCLFVCPVTLPPQSFVFRQFRRKPRFIRSDSHLPWFLRGVFVNNTPRVSL